MAPAPGTRPAAAALLHAAAAPAPRAFRLRLLDRKQSAAGAAPNASPDPSTESDAPANSSAEPDAPSDSTAEPDAPAEPDAESDGASCAAEHPNSAADAANASAEPNAESNSSSES